MQYQLRLANQDLPGFVRELTLDCCRAAEPHSDEPNPGLYKAVYRALKGALSERVAANCLCGAAAHCDWAAGLEKHLCLSRRETVPGESVRIYRLTVDVGPAEIVRDMLNSVLRKIVERLPGERVKGLATLLRRRIEASFAGRLLRSDLCGTLPLCETNEAVDPWKRHAPIQTG